MPTPSPCLLRVRTLLLALACAGVLLAGCRTGASGPRGGGVAGPDQTPMIAVAVNAWHEAAARSDFTGYFARMTDDAVFLGTDATERWTRAEFEAFCRPYFSAGRGWRYEPIDRKIMIAPDGRTAWFDERLQNAGLGECRGTGVVELGDDGAWRIAHYSLTIPIPNAIARDVAQRIRSLSGAAEPAPGEGGEPEQAAAGGDG
ncbi:MAG: nuclear transport factor 2 family protein [Phycisphaerales bacterium JB040]